MHIVCLDVQGTIYTPVVQKGLSDSKASEEIIVCLIHIRGGADCIFVFFFDQFEYNFYIRISYNVSANLCGGLVSDNDACTVRAYLGNHVFQRFDCGSLRICALIRFGRTPGKQDMCLVNQHYIFQLSIAGNIVFRVDAHHDQKQSHNEGFLLFIIDGI